MCVLGVLQEGNGGGDTEHVKHAQTDVFDVFGVSGWVGEALTCLRGDVRWKRQVGWGWGVSRWVGEVLNTSNTPRRACSMC